MENVRPEDFDPLQFADMSEEDKNRMDHIQEEERVASVAPVKKTPQTKIYVTNILKSEELFNMLFFPFSMTISKLLKAPKIADDGSMVEVKDGPEHLPIDTSTGNYITDNDAILFCTTSPICINRSDGGEPFISAFLEKINFETSCQEKANIDDDLTEDESFVYVEKIVVDNYMVLQYWNTGTIEVGVVRDFMDSGYFAIGIRDEGKKMSLSFLQ